MASQAVYDAVSARVQALWPGISAAVSADYPQLTNGIPYFMPNDAQSTVPTDGTPFLTVDFPIAKEEQITIGAPGNNRWRESGGILFTLSAPIGAGMSEWLGYLDALRAVFRGQEFGEVVTWAANSSVLNEKNDEGSYFEFSAVVPYYRDLLA